MFRPCSGLSEGKIKFELFAQRVALMFADSADPFSAVDVLLPRQGEDVVMHPQGEDVVMSHEGEDIPTGPPVTTTIPTPQPIAGPSTSRTSRTGKAVDYGILTSALSSHHITGTPVPNQGWFVAFNAVLPGVYYGV